VTRFGAGSRASVRALCDELRPSAVSIVIDAEVAHAFGDPPGLRAVHRSVVTGGEDAKDFAHWRGLLDGFVLSRLDRHAVVIAVGGGTVLDLAGFAAAVYLRGVRWIAVPTTLLAQVDAAHGGKTGIDHPAAKNLVGAFHEPAAIVVDPDYLASLPPRQVRGGLAEVIKHGIIGDPGLLEVVGRDDPASFVERAARVKLAIVERDPLEHDERRLLNLGHTLGHAFERASGYAFHHGEAVALGLRAACRIAEHHCGFGDRAAVEEALDRCGLPVRADLDADAVRRALQHDKKRRAEKLHWVLPHALGDVRVHDDMPEDVVNAALTETAAAS